MFDIPTTAFLAPSFRAFFLGLLLLIGAWLFYQLALPQPDFDNQPLNEVFQQLVGRIPPVAYWTNGRVHIAQHWLSLDCYFAIVYSILLSIGCGWLSQTTSGPSARIGALLSWLVLFSVIFDLAENAALAGLLAFPHHTLSRILAQVLGVLKWFSLIISGIYALWWLVALAANKIKLR